MAELKDIKLKLKKWETQFIREHDRKPGKEDIEANAEIKETYKTYNVLKKGASNATQGVDVWGPELNKSHSKEGVRTDKDSTKEQVAQSSCSTKIAQNLWQQACTTTSMGKVAVSKKGQMGRSVLLPANEDKSISCFKKKDTPRPQWPVRRNKWDFLSIPSLGPALEEAAKEEHAINAAEEGSLAISPKEGSIFARALKVTQNLKTRSFSTGTMGQEQADFVLPVKKSLSSFSRRTMDQGLLSQLDSEDDHFLSQHQVELSTRSHKTKTANDNHKRSTVQSSSAVEKQNTLEQSSSFEENGCSFTTDSVFMGDSPKSLSVTSPVGDKLATQSNDNRHQVPAAQSNDNRHQAPAAQSNDNQHQAPAAQSNDNRHQAPAAQSNDNRHQAPAAQSNDNRHQAPAAQSNDNRHQAPAGHSHDDKPQGPATTDFNHQRAPLSQLDYGNEARGRNDQTGQEGRGQKRKKGFPDEQDKDVMIDSDKKRKVDSSEEEMQEERTSKKKVKAKKFGPSTTVSKPSGASSSQNFVRLNMKVKTYRRRGGGRTGPQLKRMQWKQKMEARAKSRGSNCFKCGGEGHWAKNCKGKKQSAVEEDPDLPPEDFPTLGEALRMARGEAPPAAKEQTKTKTPKSKMTESGKDDDPVEAGCGNYVEDMDMVEAELAMQEGNTPESNVLPPPVAEPLYQLNPDGGIPATPAAVMKGLRTFGFESFRPGQEQAVMRILCGQSTLVQLATGSGKSLCYQLPALLYAQHKPSLTLVISPLVSLMEDQVTGLPKGLNGVCLHTNMTKPQREKVVAALEAGEAHFLLLSPEALVGAGRGLLNFSRLPPIAFACIDEAHCVSSWSHHFRPSYLRVCKVLREKMGVRCLLGLTATATKSTACSVAHHLGITKPDEAFIRGTAIPDNLILSVSRDEDRDCALIELLRGDRFAMCHSIIVYCTRRDTTERLATLIRTNLKDAERKCIILKPSKSKSKKVIPLAEAYHAGLTPAARKRVQTNFMNGALQIVVATVAFGMGLDKQDVRGVIHYNLPRNFESYVQEIGRAGRDGETSHCHVFLSEMAGDMMELKRHIYSNTVDRVSIKKLVSRVFTRCRCERFYAKLRDCDKEESEKPNSQEVVCRGHQRAVPIESLVTELDMREEGISTLLCYLELHEQRWLEVYPPVYSTCTLKCYGGHNQLNVLARKCPAVAVAVAQAKLQGRTTDQIDFSLPVFEVADSLGTDPVTVKRELARLKWYTTPTGYQRSNVMIEFSELAFHIRCRGNLTDEETDTIVTMLTDRMTSQESTQLNHLHYFHSVLHAVSHKNFYMCADVVDMDRCERLKAQIRRYFNHQPPEGSGDAPPELPGDMATTSPVCPLSQGPSYNEDMVCGDVRQFINLYSDEHTLTARAIARIFHGIASPNFPADVWGRVRRFWRCHLDVEFNVLLAMTKRTLIGMK